jgi:hypothetical protein
MSKARDLANAGTALTSVSATELGYLDGVTSAVQTQINTKQATVSGVNDTEIGYLDGVTSAIQTQLNAKEATLPSQTGNSGKYLTTNGTDKSWGTISTAPTVVNARIETSQTTTNESTFIDLATVGPTVTLTTGTKALVTITCETQQITGGVFGLVGFAVSGATTIAATEARCIRIAGNGSNSQSSCTFMLTNLTAGSNTFTLKYRGSGGGFTHTFLNREIIVMNLGS